MSIKTWFDRLWGRIPADPINRVKVNRKGIVVHLAKSSYKVPWETVSTIAIHYVTGSPEPKDTHYILDLPKRQVRISLKTPGMTDFVSRLQHVPGLHRRAYSNAMKFYADTPVVIWENPGKS